MSSPTPAHEAAAVTIDPPPYMPDLPSEPTADLSIASFVSMFSAATPAEQQALAAVMAPHVPAAEHAAGFRDTQPGTPEAHKTAPSLEDQLIELRDVDPNDPVQLGLLYVQARSDIMSGAHPCSQVHFRRDALTLVEVGVQ